MKPSTYMRAMMDDAKRDAAKRRKSLFDLYLQSGSDFSIVDQHGKKYTVEEARGVYESPDYSGDCNLAFSRLIANDFNLDAVKAHFGAAK